MNSRSQYLEIIDAFLSPTDFPGSIVVNFKILYVAHALIASLPIIVLKLTNNLVVGGAAHIVLMFPVIAVLFGFPIFAFVRRGLLRERMEEQSDG